MPQARARGGERIPLAARMMPRKNRLRTIALSGLREQAAEARRNFGWVIRKTYRTSYLLCEQKALEGSGWASGRGADGADERKVAADVETLDWNDADGAEAHFLADGPLGDEAGAEAFFDGGNDGNDGVEFHGNAQVAPAQAGTAQGEFDDAPGAGAALAHDQRHFGERAHGDDALRRPGIAAADDEHHAVFEDALAEDLATGD